MKRGPKTAEGKEAVSKNAVQHGLTGRLLHLSAEETANFEALKRKLHQELAPVGTLEQIAVDDIAVNFWRYVRALQWEATLFRRVSDSTASEGIEEAESVPGKRELRFHLETLHQAHETLGLGGLKPETEDRLRQYDPEFLKELNFRPTDPNVIYAVLLEEGMKEKAELYPGLEDPIRLDKEAFKREFPGTSEDAVRRVQYVTWATAVRQMKQKLLAREEAYLLRLWELAEKQKLLQEHSGNGVDSATRYIASIRKALYHAMSVYATLKDARSPVRG